MPALGAPSSQSIGASRVVVLVPHSGLPIVFRASAEQMIAQTEVILSDTLRLPTLPKALPRPNFQQTWEHMCMDLNDARHFDSVAEALRHYRTNSDRLTPPARAAVLRALERLERHAQPAAGFAGRR